MFKETYKSHVPAAAWNTRYDRTGGIGCYRRWSHSKAALDRVEHYPQTQANHDKGTLKTRLLANRFV